MDLFVSSVSVESMFDTVSKLIRKCKKSKEQNKSKSVKKELKEEL
jgi:hypothetical protein